MNNQPPVIELREATKTYRRGIEDVHALAGVSLAINRGDFLAVVGHSGSGKTTLLNMLGCMDTPTSGRVLVNGRDLTFAKERELAVVRKTTVGFVFQQFFLVPTLTVRENIEIPLLFAGKSNGESRVDSLMEAVGMANRADHLPGQLSGGEMQRVVVARALVNSPDILLADEPTGNLDSRNAEGIMGLFADLNSRGLAIVMVTHNLELAGRAHRMLRMEDGKFVD